jgi:predicted flavoprotein YhiN
MLKAWTERLSAMGAAFEYGRECTGFETIPAGAQAPTGLRLSFAEGAPFEADAACFCLGGASYEPEAEPLRWPRIFEARGAAVAGFEASNVGFQVDWPAGLLAEAEGKPVKNVVLSSSRGRRSGDLVITSYGLEGTPVYFAGERGLVHLDLKPDLTEAQLLSKLRFSKENLSPIRRAKRFLHLGEGALALVFHMAPREAMSDLAALAAAIKRFPIELRAKQPLSEAISSSGGLRWDELDDQLMLKRAPGVFVAGEMIDWDAPTGGFLIQACVSQGYRAGQALARRGI